MGFRVVHGSRAYPLTIVYLWCTITSRLLSAAFARPRRALARHSDPWDKMTFLRKSPTLTPKMLAAKRRNARRSTGPTTAGGPWNASQNALQHGHYARSLRRSMLALRENAEEFDRVYREAHGAQTAPWQPVVSAPGCSTATRNKKMRNEAGISKITQVVNPKSSEISIENKGVKRRPRRRTELFLTSGT